MERLGGHLLGTTPVGGVYEQTTITRDGLPSASGHAGSFESGTAFSRHCGNSSGMFDPDRRMDFTIQPKFFYSVYSERQHLYASAARGELGSCAGLG
jgi:hypothetical protein